MRAHSLIVGSWNVAGFSHEDSDALAESIHNTIKRHSVDILALQELSFPPQPTSELSKFASNVGLPYAEAWDLSQSHRRSGHRLGIAILSRSPFSDVRRVAYPNPNIILRSPSGMWISHDRGLLFAAILHEQNKVNVGTTHLLPFHHFGRESTDPEFAPGWVLLEQAMLSVAHQPSIVLGDFNTDSLGTVLPTALQATFVPAVHVPTRSSGEQHDNILCTTHWKALRVQVVPSVTNHHFCKADLQLLP